MGAVGRPHLAQMDARLLHDVGNAEGAANLDQLSARNHGLAPLTQRVQRDQDGGGVVVDDRGILGPGQLAEKAAQVVVALAATAAGQIIFQRCRRAHGVHRRRDGLFGQDRAAKVGVQDRAGQVQDRPETRATGPRQILRDPGQNGIGLRQRIGRRGAQLGQTRPNGRGHDRMPMFRNQPARLLKQPVDAGQIAQVGRHQNPIRNGLKPPRVHSVSRIFRSRPRLATSSATGSMVALRF